MNKILLFSVFSILTFNVMAQKRIVQTAGREQLGEFAPNLQNSTMMFCSERCGAARTNSVFATVVW